VRNLIKTLAATAPLVHPDADREHFKKRMKYCARGLAQSRLTRQWFDLLHRPELAVVARHHPYIYCKLQRPYLHRKLDARGRLEVLKQHYQFVAARFSRLEMEAIYASPGLLLAKIPLAEAGNFAVNLCYGRHEKEGDLLLNLVNLDSAKALFEMSFCITKFDVQGGEALIGGLQGNKSANDRESIVALTRAMHGLRPKALLVFALQQLAVVWKIGSIRAVGDGTHIYRHPHKRKDLETSYDEFWLECGGTLADDGMFDLPAEFVPREISTLKVNKRQLYRRRYLMLAGLASQIRAAWMLAVDS
jgi:uncharacterized protein VirK/YbjX